MTGGAGADDIICGANNDVLVYNGASESTSTGHDNIHGFDASFDRLDLNVTVAGYDGVAFATVNSFNFNADIAAAFSGGANHAWDVHAVGGDQATHDFLVVDTNGNGHYDAGTDYVFEIAYVNTLNLGDFI